MVKLTTFSVMCKAYGGGADVPKALHNPITYLGNWKGSFFFIENKIIPSNYPELLLGKNKLDKKSFEDKVPFNPEMDPLYDQIATYPCISVNNNALMIDATPLSSVYPTNVVKNVANSDDPSYGEDEQTLIGLPPKVQKVPARASKVAGEASTPLDVDSDYDIHEFPSAKELKDVANCHWVVAHVTPPSWKQHLREISIEQLCDIHDRAYMRQAVLNNVLNSRTQEIIPALYKAKTSYDAIRARELDKDKAYAELERKCNEAL
ncbi:hypothetical protein Tco_1336244 [Tanacetum coccineum]